MSDSHASHSPMFAYQPALPIPNGKTCLWLFLSTEIMFFAGLIGTYIVLRFGAVRSVVTAPGLYFKLPAPFEQVVYLDNRILDLDLPAQEIIAADQKRLVVDAFTRYRISDPLRFYQAVNNIPRANSQLASIVNGNVRSVLAEATFTSMASK